MKYAIFLLTLTQFPFEGDEPSQTPRYNFSDFYYYRSENEVEGLALTDKLVVIFDNQWESEEQAQYFFDFNASVAPVNSVLHSASPAFHVMTLRVDAGIQLDRYIVDVLNRAPRTAFISPVVIVGGRECFLSNEIVIEANPSVTFDMAEERLRSVSRPIGDFNWSLARGSQPRQYRLTISNLRWPSNILVLANLLSEQPWVNYAQVVFRPIDLPIFAEFEFVPDAAPSLGERRLLVMAVTVTDSHYRLDVDMLPQLGRGEFAFSSQQNEVFFHAEDAEIEEYRRGNSIVTVIRWPFYVFAVGNWSFSAVDIPYTVTRDNGLEERASIRAQPPVFSVGSVIGAAVRSVGDIQPLAFYPMPAVETSAETSVSAEQPDWFDKNRELLGWAGIACASLIALTAGVVVVVRKVRALSGKMLIRRQKRRACQRLKEAAGRITSESDYVIVEKILRSCVEEVLGIAFRAITVYDLERERLPYLTVEEQALITNALKVLERRQNPNYKADAAHLDLLSSCLKNIARFLNKKGR